jgi:hypothetical protein
MLLVVVIRKLPMLPVASTNRAKLKVFPCKDRTKKQEKVKKSGD